METTIIPDRRRRLIPLVIHLSILAIILAAFLFDFLHIAFLPAFLIWLVHLYRRRELLPPLEEIPLIAPLFLLFITSGLSSLWALDVAASFTAWVRLGTALILYVIVFVAIKVINSIHPVSTGVFILLLSVVAWHLFSYITVGEPLAEPIYLVMLGLLVAGAITDNGWPNGQRLMVGVLLLAIIPTLPPAGWVSLATGGLSFLFLQHRRLFVLLIVFLVILPFFCTDMSLQDFLRQYEDNKGRLAVWGQTVNVVQANLPLGAGTGNFAVAYEQAGYEYRPGHPYNLLMYMLVELGICGGLLLFWCILRALHLSSGFASKGSMVGYIASFFAFVVYAANHMPLFDRGLVVFIVACIAFFLQNKALANDCTGPKEVKYGV